MISENPSFHPRKKKRSLLVLTNQTKSKQMEFVLVESSISQSKQGQTIYMGRKG